MTNPDGYIYDGDGDLGEIEYWRKNRNDSTPTSYVGVDLNRNWDIKWEEGDDDPSMETYRGEAPFSEPETRYLKDFILDNDIDSYQNLHSHFGTLLIPSSNITDPTPNDDWYRGMADHMTSLTSKLGEEGEQYSYGQPHEELWYGAPGAADDWVYEETGAQAFTYEIYTGEWENFSHGFYPPEEDIMTINQDLDESLIYQTRVADTDLGDGDDILHPPVPYVVYGILEDEEGNPLPDFEVLVKNQETGESISILTDSSGYYELNFGDLVEEGYQERDLFTIEIYPGTTRLNFEVDDSWGQRIDLEHSETAQVTTEGFFDMTLDSVNLVGDVTLTDEDSVDAYFEYRIRGEEEWKRTEGESITEDGTYEIELSEDIQLGEEYEFRAMIEWNEELDRGRSMTFTFDEYQLNIDSSEGGEVVEPDEEVSDHIYGAEVEIEASADEDSEFVRWTGDVDTVEDTTSERTSVTMIDDLEITALFWTGEGTEEDPYILESVHHLPEIHENLEAYYRVADDIDARETEEWNDGDGFDPIGYMEEGFNGSLHGNGYEIKGLHIDREDEMNIGMFGEVGEEGVIDDLTLVDVNITGQVWVGGLVAVNAGEIRNSSVVGTVEAADNVGGLVAYSVGYIESSHFEGEVEGSTIVGGLVAHMGGWWQEHIDAEVRRSYSRANVSGTQGVGGLVGINGEGGTIAESFSESDVNASAEYAGGLVALNRETIENCYSTGSVKARHRGGGLVGENAGTISSSYSTVGLPEEGLQGGLIGSADEDDFFVEAEDSYWNIHTSGEERSAGGIGLNTGAMIGENAELNMEGFDFDDVWNIEEDPYTYPYLSWQEEENYPYVPYDLEHELTLEVEGEGSIRPNSSSYLCADGEEVMIKALPDDDGEFSHWEGDIPEEYDEEDEEIKITVEEDMEVTAHFEDEFLSLRSYALITIILVFVIVVGFGVLCKQKRKEDEGSQEDEKSYEIEDDEDAEVERCPECDEPALVMYEDGSGLCENCSHAEID